MRDSDLKTYIAEYPGDSAWGDFARGHGCDPTDLEAVADSAAGSISQSYLDSEIPALGGKTLREIANATPGGETIARSFLMRLP